MKNNKKFRTGADPGPSAKPKLSVDLQTLKNVMCPNCQCQTFIGATELKKVPAILSNSGKPEIAQLNILLCSKCGRKLDKADAFEEPKKVLI